MDAGLEGLRAEMEAINGELLDLLNRRGWVALRIGALKDRLGLAHFDPERERAMLQRLLAANPGPFSDAALGQIFTGVFRASAELMGAARGPKPQIHRVPGEADAVIDIAGVPLGGGHRRIIAGTGSFVDEEHLVAVAGFLQEQGIRLLRGGARGLEVLRRVADRFGLRTVGEVACGRDVEDAARWLDVLQVEGGDTPDSELLRRVGQTRKPVLLTRGPGIPLEAFIQAAETLALEGGRVILCESNLKTGGTGAFDLSAVPILKERLPFPMVVHLSQTAGRHDALLPLGRAALEAGADAVMVDLHPEPAAAGPDDPQPLSFGAFRSFHAGLTAFLGTGVPS